MQWQILSICQRQTKTSQNFRQADYECEQCCHSDYVVIFDIFPKEHQYGHCDEAREDYRQNRCCYADDFVDTSIRYYEGEYGHYNYDCFVFASAVCQFFQCTCKTRCQTNCSCQTCEQYDNCHHDNAPCAQQFFCDCYQQCCLVVIFITARRNSRAKVCQTTIDNEQQNSGQQGCSCQQTTLYIFCCITFSVTAPMIATMIKPTPRGSIV